jgi:hypothetical protein
MSDQQWQPQQPSQQQSPYGQQPSGQLPSQQLPSQPLPQWGQPPPPIPNYVPPQQQPQWAPPQFQQPPTRPPKKGFFSKKVGPVPLWALILILIVVVGVAANAGKGGSSSPSDTAQNSSTASTPSGATAQPTVAATQAPTPSPTPTHTPKWTTVQTFKGNGNKKTAIFTVPDDWKIVWSCQGLSDGSGVDGDLYVSVYGSDGGLVDANAISGTCKYGKATSDSTEEHQGGSVYLDVSSGAIETWSIQVQELK